MATTSPPTSNPPSIAAELDFDRFVELVDIARN